MASQKWKTCACSLYKKTFRLYSRRGKKQQSLKMYLPSFYSWAKWLPSQPCKKHYVCFSFSRHPFFAANCMVGSKQSSCDLTWDYLPGKKKMIIRQCKYVQETTVSCMHFAFSLLHPIDDILCKKKDNDPTFEMVNDGNSIMEGDKQRAWYLAIT